VLGRAAITIHVVNMADALRFRVRRVRVGVQVIFRVRVAD